MISDLYECRCQIPWNGYKWIASTTRQQFLVREPLGNFGVWTYEPLRESTGLFRDFASLSATKEAILEFVKHHGGLGCEEEFEAKSSDASAPAAPMRGEPFSLWTEQIHAMRRLVHLWDLCKAGDVAGLSKSIVWSDSSAAPELHYRAVPVVSSPSEASFPAKKVLLASSSYHAERFEMFSRDDLIGPALFQLGQEVSAMLAPLTPVVSWQREESRLRRRLVVPDLKTALWLQFAEAIDGNKVFRSCEDCGRWFELSPKLARTSRIFCSGKCRVRRYRLRRENARQLFSEGRTMKKIAEEMGTDIGTVKGWLKQE